MNIVSFPPNMTRIRLGRSNENEVVLDVAEADNQCELVKTAEGWKMTDLSGKGTCLDGQRVKQGFLAHRSHIAIGDLHIRICELEDEILVISSRSSVSSATVLDL